RISTSTWSWKETASWTAGTSSVADEAAAPAFLRRAAPAALWARGELGIRILAEYLRPARRSDLRTQVPLDPAPVSTRLSDGGNVVGLSHRRRVGSVARAAQPARCGAC